jgi:hypothetical protein
MSELVVLSLLSFRSYMMVTHALLLLRYDVGVQVGVLTDRPGLQRLLPK